MWPKKKKKKKEAHSEREGDHLQTLCTQQKKIKNAQKNSLFPSVVGGMNYALEEHIILSLSADYCKSLGN